MNLPEVPERAGGRSGIVIVLCSEGGASASRSSVRRNIRPTGGTAAAACMGDDGAFHSYASPRIIQCLHLYIPFCRRCRCRSRRCRCICIIASTPPVPTPNRQRARKADPNPEHPSIAGKILPNNPAISSTRLHRAQSTLLCIRQRYIFLHAAVTNRPLPPHRRFATLKARHRCLRSETRLAILGIFTAPGIHHSQTLIVLRQFPRPTSHSRPGSPCTPRRLLLSSTLTLSSLCAYIHPAWKGIGTASVVAYPYNGAAAVTSVSPGAKQRKPAPQRVSRNSTRLVFVDHQSYCIALHWTYPASATLQSISTLRMIHVSSTR